MKQLNPSLIAVLVLLVFACRLSNAEASKERQSEANIAGNDPVAIVQQACKGAATVSRVVPPGKAGQTLVVLEETHNSLAVQLELAAVLVRLHASGLTDVVLEGYLKDDVTGAARKPVSRDWFSKAAGSLPSDVQRETASRLLMEGEISAAEFLFLGYDDVKLIPAETVSVRGGDYNEKHTEAVIKAIGLISEAVLQSAVAKGRVDIAKFNQLATLVQSAADDEAKKQAVQALMNYISTLDPWLMSAYGTLTNADLAARAALTDQARLHEELDGQAKKWGVTVDNQLLKEGAEFFRQREKANAVMLTSIPKLESRLVALNVGAAHTGGIIELLKKMGLGVIVVTPLSLHDKAGRLTTAQFEAKQQLRSVYDTGHIARVLKMIPAITAPKKKKPEPSSTEPWCQAKGELYAFMSRITRGILGSPQLPGGGQPPFGFENDAFRGEFFFIDLRRVRYLPAETAILFPIALKNEPERVVLWVKSVKSDWEGMPAMALSQSGTELAPMADAEREVAMLLAQRDAVKFRSEPPSTAEDRPTPEGGDLLLIQVDIKTLAIVGSDEMAVASAVVSER